MVDGNKSEHRRKLKCGIGDLVATAGLITTDVGIFGGLYNAFKGDSPGIYLPLGFMGIGAMVVGLLFSEDNRREDEQFLDYSYKDNEENEGGK